MRLINRSEIRKVTPLDAQLSHTSVFTMCLCVRSLFALWCTVNVLHMLANEKKQPVKWLKNPSCMTPSSPDLCVCLWSVCHRSVILAIVVHSVLDHATWLMSNFHAVFYGMFPMCHVSNKMQKSQFNAKYDCPHEEAATFSLLLIWNIKLLVLWCTFLEMIIMMMIIMAWFLQKVRW